ncbi:hypothetical protein BKA67DRAFT_299198 [Truncatella angustata]|uniref:Uncharacterized protein n=1 Tax=Truncatella angustata TaxID=152316 RepID=A0A9P8ZW85_9PEZI|nr:uncharacterized protein BKA67DRAFT_299198 [Truncatella angustata]KAH6652712.1 hypothetical protein BKA67DRAFT_299198 [Truncatella angustata]
MALVPSPSIAEQISKPSELFPLNTPKFPTWVRMIPILGTRSSLGIQVGVCALRLKTLANSWCFQGQEWKDLRKISNPVSTTQHL